MWINIRTRLIVLFFPVALQLCLCGYVQFFGCKEAQQLLTSADSFV